MAQEVDSTLFGRIAQKSRFLVARYTTLAAELNRAQARIAALEAEKMAREKELEQLRARVEYLSVSSALAPDAEDMESTRELLTALLKQVDSCLADLQT